MSKKTYIAVDLGAGSGRVMAAVTDATTVTLKELHRFENRGTDLPGGAFWDLVGLYREILEGLHQAVNTYGDSIVSIGIDTWGCDFSLINPTGTLIGMAHQYRDPRFEGMAERMHERMSEADIYARTGIKTNFYNSSLHLLAERRRDNPALQAARRLLFMPDILAYWLTGRQTVERTIASTSQLLDPRTGDWAWEVIDALDLPRHLFGEIVAPGTVIGPIRPEVGHYIGKNDIPVVATASHDTAAAVAGIPLEGDDHLWLSSGTWSILGIESTTPITTRAALEAGFSNEIGVENRIRFLKNISGLWLLQECKRQWEHEGETIGFSTMAKLAEAAPPFSAFIDPDDPVFANPGDMPEKIADWCARTGQTVPKDKGSILRVATDSLAFKYRFNYDHIVTLTGRKFQTLHIGGGGIQNQMLCQATANAIGIDVIAGPVEATSCGNVIVQMLATGDIDSLAAGRQLIRRSFEFKHYTPQDTECWNHAYQAFRKLVG